MKIRNEPTHPPLPDTLVAKLEERRRLRGFDAERYIAQKVELIEKYTSRYNLNAVVVAVSGGIDSAVVLGLVQRAKNLKVIPALLPAYAHDGVTNQDSATERGREVCETFSVEPLEINMAPLAEAIGTTTSEALNSLLEAPESAWGRGQLVPYTRTPVLYYLTTLLTDNGYKAFIAGTTNYSEGAYLGYIGKASDAMVDVQMISDLYKSEVYAVAEALGVPQSILDVTPTGDMFDATSDEDVFGASYDFVELYMEFLGLYPQNKEKFIASLDKEAGEYFALFSDRLDAMHSYNKHKYLAGSPAVHLDIDSPVTFEGFWKKTVWEGK